MLPDYHIHTCFSGDSHTPPRDQVERALALGMESICFTDHHDKDVTSPIDFTLDIGQYVPAIQALQQEYQGRIQVGLGIELGLQVHLGEYIAGLARCWPFDLVIGSTHFVGGRDPYFPEYFQGREESAAYREYFEALLENIMAIEDYDVVGHIDYVVRYGPNRNRFYSYERYKDVLDAILEVVVKEGKGIECNSAGYRKGLGEPNPSRQVLCRYRELGGEIVTIGSDAHAPEDLGADFKAVGRLLQECGFSYYATFQNRKPMFHKLER